MSSEFYQYLPPVLALGFCLFLVLEAKFLSWQFDREHGDERAKASGFLRWLVTPTKAELLEENERLKRELSRVPAGGVGDSASRSRESSK